MKTQTYKKLLETIESLEIKVNRKPLKIHLEDVFTLLDTIKTLVNLGKIQHEEILRLTSLLNHYNNNDHDYYGY